MELHKLVALFFFSIGSRRTQFFFLRISMRVKRLSNIRSAITGKKNKPEIRLAFDVLRYKCWVKRWKRWRRKQVIASNLIPYLLHRMHHQQQFRQIMCKTVQPETWQHFSMAFAWNQTKWIFPHHFHINFIFKLFWNQYTYVTFEIGFFFSRKIVN